MKRRILSLIVAVALITVQFVIPATVSASTSLPEPVFAMDLSEYTADNQTVKNGVTSSAEGITVKNAAEGVTPNVKKYYSASGEKVLALQTANDNDTYSSTSVNKLGAVKISSDKISQLLGNNGDEMTITFWSKAYMRSSASAAYGVSTSYTKTSVDKDCTIGNFSYNANVEWKPVTTAKPEGSTKAVSATTKVATDSWVFNAVSRKWTEDAENPGTGTWTYTIMNDSTAVKDNVTTAKMSYVSSEGMNFNIGGVVSSSDALSNIYCGEIAGFNVYNSALTKEQLASIQTAQNYTTLVAEADMPQTFTQNAVSDGTSKNVSTTGATHVIEFNTFIDAATLSAITLKDSDGNAPEDFAVTSNGKKAFVSYKSLVDGKNYTLSISNGLKSVNGVSAMPASMTLKASSAHAPVFTMDLSDYTEAAKTVKNGALTTPSADGITVYTASADVAPELKKYYGANGTEVRALAISDSAGSNQLGVVDISAAKIAELLGNGGDEMTITFWSKKYTTGYGSLFNYGNGTRDDASTMRSFTTGNDEMVALSSAHSPTKYTKKVAAGDWVFHAISRKWLPDENGTGKWRYNVIIGSNESGDLYSSTYTHASTENMTFTIGGRVNASTGALYTYCHKGEIAGFNIYNTERSQAELAAIRTAESAIYGDMTAEADMPDTFALVTEVSDTLSPYAGSIELEFDNVIAPASAKAGIKLYDSYDKEVNTIVNISGKTAKIQFADLKDQSLYKLSLTDDLKSANNITFEEPGDIYFNTDTSIAELTFDADENGKPTDESFNFMSSLVSGDLNDFAVMEEDGVKFIRMNHRGWGVDGTNHGDTYLCYDFDTAPTGNFALDLKIRLGDSPALATDRRLTLNRSNNYTVHNLHKTNIGIHSLDDAEFVNMRYTFVNMGNNVWKVTKYDRLTDALQTRNDYGSAVESFTVTGGIKNIGMKLWLQSNITPYTDIAEFKLYGISGSVPAVMVTNSEGKQVCQFETDGTYTVEITPDGIGSAQDILSSDLVYAYFAVYKKSPDGSVRLAHSLGGQVNDRGTFTDEFTLDVEDGCTYTAKCMLWQDNLTPLIRTINYK